MDWHTRVQQVHGVYFAKTILMQGFLPPEKIIIWDALRSHDAEVALRDVLAAGHPFKLRISGTLTCLDHRSGDEFKYHVQIPAINVNPSQRQARDVRLASADQLALWIAKKVFERIKGLEHVENRGYDISVASLDEVRIQIAPGGELMAAWRSHRGQGYRPLPPELLAKWVNPQSGKDPRCFLRLRSPGSLPARGDRVPGRDEALYRARAWEAF